MKKCIFFTDSNIGEEFRNRKGSFSINVQVVYNASLMFQNVVARWPGSTHDATIFNHSDLKGTYFLMVNKYVICCITYLLTTLKILLVYRCL